MALAYAKPARLIRRPKDSPSAEQRYKLGSTITNKRSYGRATQQWQSATIISRPGSRNWRQAGLRGVAYSKWRAPRRDAASIAIRVDGRVAFIPLASRHSLGRSADTTGRGQFEFKQRPIRMRPAAGTKARGWRLKLAATSAECCCCPLLLLLLVVAILYSWS